MRLGRAGKAASQVTNRLCGIWHRLRVITAEVKLHLCLFIYFLPFGAVRAVD